MKALTNLVLIVALLVGGAIYMGYISVDDLKDIVLGEVTMGETKHKYTEADFKQVFDLIVGEVEVTDTSSTAFERSNPLCDKAYVMHTADAVLKYEVKTTSKKATASKPATSNLPTLTEAAKLLKPTSVMQWLPAIKSLMPTVVLT